MAYSPPINASEPIFMKTLCLILLAGLAFPALAEDPFTREFKDHVVHYNVFPSSVLDPAVARQYQLKRAANIHTLNLAVHRKTDKGTVPVDALLKGTVTNFFQQQQELEFQRVKEGDAVYFLAQFRVKDENPLTFDFYIRPEGYSQTYELRFRRPLQ